MRLGHAGEPVARRNMSTGARAMSTALVLVADGRREGGRWKRGSVLVGNSESANSGWKDRLKEAGTVLDHKPDLAPTVIAGGRGAIRRVLAESTRPALACSSPHLRSRDCDASAHPKLVGASCYSGSSSSRGTISTRIGPCPLSR